MSAGTLLFVYGSLRRDCGWNSGYLDDAEFVCKGRTAGRCALYVCKQSGLPYLALDHPVSQVVGEVYRISDQTLAVLDQLEGIENDFYFRMPLGIEQRNGEAVEAQAYVWLHSTTDLELVLSGDWLDTQC